MGMQESISIQFHSPSTTNKKNKQSIIAPVTTTPSITSKSTTSATTPTMSHQQLHQQQQVLQPRKTDAALSCPCCFQIVCMDCQRHERYSNQFRAMFVMNITVDWNRTILPHNVGTTTTTTTTTTGSSQKRVLLEENGFGGIPSIPMEEEEDGLGGGTTNTMDDTQEENGDDVYYSVHCASCNTQVAALDRMEEVYYFFGCLETA